MFTVLPIWADTAAGTITLIWLLVAKRMGDVAMTTGVLAVVWNVTTVERCVAPAASGLIVRG